MKVADFPLFRKSKKMMMATASDLALILRVFILLKHTCSQYLKHHWDSGRVEMEVLGACHNRIVELGVLEKLS